MRKLLVMLGGYCYNLFLLSENIGTTAGSTAEYGWRCSSEVCHPYGNQSRTAEGDHTICLKSLQSYTIWPSGESLLCCPFTEYSKLGRQKSGWALESSNKWMREVFFLTSI